MTLLTNGGPYRAGDTLLFRTVITNINDAFDSTLCTFVAPFDGVYEILLVLSGSHVQASIVVDDVIVALLYHTDELAYSSLMTSTLQHLSRGSSVKVVAASSDFQTDVMSAFGVHSLKKDSGWSRNQFH